MIHIFFSSDFFSKQNKFSLTFHLVIDITSRCETQDQLSAWEPRVTSWDWSGLFQVRRDEMDFTHEPISAHRCIMFNFFRENLFHFLFLLSLLFFTLHKLILLFVFSSSFQLFLTPLVYFHIPAIPFFSLSLYFSFSSSSYKISKLIILFWEPE
jgi:hypothetical protein